MHEMQNNANLTLFTKKSLNTQWFHHLDFFFLLLRFLPPQKLTRLLEGLQMLVGQLLDRSGYGFKGSFQSLSQHHVVRLSPQTDAVLVLVS